MDIMRAKEILETDRTIDVKLDGIPIWIDSVDAGENKVRVHPKHNPSQLKEVSADQLMEV